MTDVELQSLSKWVQNIQSLVSFKFLFDQCQFTEMGIQQLGNALKQHTKLRNLDLFNCRQNPLGGNYLKEALFGKYSLVNLSLYIHRSNIASDIIEISDSISKNEQIQTMTFCISENNIQGKDCAISVGNMLSQLQKLEKLDLYLGDHNFNLVSDYIFDGLSQHKHLESVYLYINQMTFTKESISVLGRSLSSCMHLKILAVTFSESNANDLDMQAFLTGISNLKELDTIQFALDGCLVTDKIFQLFIKELQNCSKLTSFDLSFNGEHFSNQSFIEFFQDIKLVLKEKDSQITLDIADCMLKDNDLEVIFDILEQIDLNFVQITTVQKESQITVEIPQSLRDKKYQFSFN